MKTTGITLVMRWLFAFAVALEAEFELLVRVDYADRSSETSHRVLVNINNRQVGILAMKHLIQHIVNFFIVAR